MSKSGENERNYFELPSFGVEIGKDEGKMNLTLVKREASLLWVESWNISAQGCVFENVDRVTVATMIMVEWMVWRKWFHWWWKAKNVWGQLNSRFKT